MQKIRRHTGFAAGLVLVGFAALAWALATSGRFAFLVDRAPARWIRYPAPANMRARPLVALPASFTREFLVEVPPPSARLRVETLGHGEVRINGRTVATLQAAPGPTEADVDVARELRAGRNHVEVEVANPAGPPLLWLSLWLQGATVVTDSSWTSTLAGAALRPAALAAAGPGGRRFDPDGVVVGAVQGLREVAPTLLGWALLAVVLVLALERLARRHTGARWPLAAGTAVVGVVWGALLLVWNRRLPLEVGFDAPDHLAYVAYILRERAVPLASEGWQMFQPPLYYALAAAGLAAVGSGPFDPGAAGVVRALNLGIGLLHLAVVAAFLARVLPSRRARLGGLAVAGALPAMLLIHQFPTNETLGAALGSATVLATVVVLQDGLNARRAATLGAIAGLALLAKFSTLLLLPFALGAVGLRSLRTPAGEPVRRLGAAALTPAALLLVAGWHFARVWLRLGAPFVGGWEARPGLGWWLDPGYRTPAHFLGATRWLSEPAFAGLEGIWSGLLGTLLGDGLLSGAAGASPLPPWWSPELHGAGLLLGLVPLGLAVLGLVCWTGRAARRPGPVDVLVLGVPAVALVALLAMTLRVPTVAQDKAYYGLLALAPAAALAGLGAERISAIGRAAGVLVAVALLTWATNVVATFRLDDTAPWAAQREAMARAARGEVRAAVAILDEAVAAHPEVGSLRVARGRLLLEEGAPAEAVVEALGAQEGDHAGRSLAIGLFAEREGALEAARAAALRALALEADDDDAWALLARMEARLGRPAEAVRAGREALRVDPWNARAHVELAGLLTAAGQGELAARHVAWAEALTRARPR